MKLVVIAAAGIASMTSAIDRGDVDEAVRQGELAGPAVVAKALAGPARSTRLAAIAAAPATEDRAELVPLLAQLAAGPDRRTAIPAARAARAIARELAAHPLPDDLASDDLASWGGEVAAIARDPDRFVEVRVLALDTASALAHAIDPAALGFELHAMLTDRDPAVRAAAIAVVPEPVPPDARPPLAAVVADDADPGVALAAAAVLCADLVAEPPASVLAALGPRAIERIRAVAVGRDPQARDARRCLNATSRR